MKDYFKEQYNLILLSCDPNNVGLNNVANVIATNEGKFFQKVYQRLPSKDIERIIRLIDYMSIRDFPVPKPIRSTRGEYVIEYQGKPSVLFSHLSGEIKKQFSERELFEVGRTLAELHLDLNAYPNLKNFVKENEDYNLTSWYDNNITMLRKLGSLESRLIVEEYAELQKQKPTGLDLNKLPLSLLHWDFRNENILFQDNRITGITDFECVRYDNRIYDVIFSVIGFCMLDGSLNKKGMNAVLEGYSSVSSLEQSELEAFPFMLKLMTWDKWASIYLSSEKGLSDRRKSRIKHNHYKKCYLSIKNDTIL